jgi:transposase
MLRTFRYRLYPNQTQRERIRKTIDACRFVYNWALETKKTAYETDETNLSWFDLNTRLPELKKKNPFLKDAYSQSLQHAVKRVMLAFEHFFCRITEGKEQQGYPKFQRRKARRQSFEVPQFFTIDFATRRVRLPKIGAVKTVFHRQFSSKHCNGCGNLNEELTLSDRTWTCPACGLLLDRDVNAAKNIKMMGLRSIMTPREPREEPVKLSALAEASKQEAPSLKTE